MACGYVLYLTCLSCHACNDDGDIYLQAFTKFYSKTFQIPYRVFGPVLYLRSILVSLTAPVGVTCMRAFFFFIVFFFHEEGMQG